MLHNPSRFAGPASAILMCAVAGFGQGLGLEELIRLGLEKNRELALERQEVHTASIDTLSEATAVNPTLEAEARHNLDEPDRPSAGIRLSKDFQPGIRDRMKSASRAEWEARRGWLRAREVELVESIRTAYYDWQILDRKAALQREVIERWDRLARLASGQVAQGRISEVDQAEAQLNAAKARQSELALLAERDARENDLQVLIGQPGVPAPLARETLDTLPRLPAHDTLAAWLKSGNPELLALRGDEEAGRRRLRVEERAAVPGFKLSLGYDREVEGYDMVGAGVEVPLSLFNRNRAAMLKARSAIKEMELRRAAAEARLEADASALHRRLARLAEQYRQYQGGIRDLIRKQLGLSEKGFREGLLGVFDLSRVQAEYLAQEEQALGILEAYYRDWNRLDKLVGGRL